MYSIDDWILTHLFLWKKFDAKAKLKVKKRIVSNKGADKAIFFFPYWTGKSNLYNGLAKNFKDYTQVFYDYPKEIMSRNINVSIKYHRELLVDAFNLILDLRKKGFKKIVLVGSSSGSNFALKLATMVRVDKLVLNMLDRNMASGIFTSPAMSLLRKRLEKQGVTLQNLDKIYAFMSTEYLVPTLKKTNTELLIYLSKNDIFCTFDDFKPVISELDKFKINYKLKINRFLGHILSIYKNLFFSKNIVDFIRKE
jgi:esterase/lipase